MQGIRYSMRLFVFYSLSLLDVPFNLFSEEFLTKSQKMRKIFNKFNNAMHFLFSIHSWNLVCLLVNLYGMNFFLQYFKYKVVWYTFWYGFCVVFKHSFCFDESFYGWILISSEKHPYWWAHLQSATFKASLVQ